jgi:inositol hexakisphosphate/diphosphoinositol-pentakisphosphate kinase
LIVPSYNLDLTQITFELYERNSTQGSEYSLRIGLSVGAHDPNLIELDLPVEHSLTVAQRKWITDHVSLDDALLLFKPTPELLSNHQ